MRAEDVVAVTPAEDRVTPAPKRRKRRKKALRWTGRLARTRKTAGLGLRAAARWSTTLFGNKRQREERGERVMLRTADDVTRTMGEMKGVAMKLGQIFSLMGGVVPEAAAERMSELQSNAPPMSPELVEQVFRRDFGKPPEKLFKRWEREPFAAASIGQVHRARLHSGEDVAVKVQYPGVKEAIEHDLANLGLMFGMLGVASRGLNTGPLVQSIKEGIRQELDYRQEARNQQRFGEMFAGHPFIVIPKVYPELGSERVLVQEFIKGHPFAWAKSRPADERNRFAEIIFRFTFGALHQYGLFQGDPHAGNYLLLDDGRVAFLDFGCVLQLGAEMRSDLNQMIAGVVTGDIELWRDRMEKTGYFPPDLDLPTGEIWQHMKPFYDFVLEDGVQFTPELASEMVRRNLQLTGEAGKINRQLNIPQELVFTQRINFGFVGLMATLRAQGPWHSISREYVLDETPTTPLGKASYAWRPGEHV